MDITMWKSFEDTMLSPVIVFKMWLNDKYQAKPKFNAPKLINMQSCNSNP